MLLFTPIVVVVFLTFSLPSLDLRVLDDSCEKRGSDVIEGFDVGVT